MKRLLFLVLAAMLCLGVGLAISCSGGEDDDDDSNDDDDTGDDDTGGDDTGDDDDERDVSDLSASDCLPRDKDDEGFTELLALDWDGGATLSVEHGPTCNNCGFEVAPTYIIEDDKLIVREHSQADFMYADCDCLFEYSYDLTEVPAGAYTIELYTVYHGDGEGEQRLNFSEQIALPDGQADQLSFSQDHEGLCI